MFVTLLHFEGMGVIYVRTKAFGLGMFFTFRKIEVQINSMHQTLKL